MKPIKLMTMPIQHLIMLAVSIMTSMIALFGIIGTIVSQSFASQELVMPSLVMMIIVWGLYGFMRNLTEATTYSKLITVVILYLLLIAAAIYNPILLRPMWVFLMFFPLLSSLLTTYRQYGYGSAVFLVTFTLYTVFGPTDLGIEADALVFTAGQQILLAIGSVIVGGIMIIARQQQQKQYEEQALQQQKQQIFHMLECFISVGERKTQTSRSEISEMGSLLKSLWKAYSGEKNKDWEIDLLSLMHFVSRVKLPDYMFEKEGKLSEFEYEVVHEHCYMAKELCNGIPGFLEVQNAFLYHHEKINGTGYPFQLKEDQIPVLSQMLGLVEVFLAMTTRRSYRQAISVSDAYEEIKKLAGSSFREDIVLAFGKVIHKL